MNGTNIICGMNGRKYCSLGGCGEKAVVLDDEGNCLSKEIITVRDAAEGAAKDAAEGVLVYGA